MLLIKIGEKRMAEDSKTEAIWNFDDERLKDLNWRLIVCEDAFENWDMQGVRKYLYSIRRILWGALDKGEQKKIAEKFKDLEEYKRKMEEDSVVTPKERLKFFNKADEIFLYLGELRSEHGLEFRKKREESGL